jgi:hypothetical protein
MAFTKALCYHMKAFYHLFYPLILGRIMRYIIFSIEQEIGWDGAK